MRLKIKPSMKIKRRYILFEKGSKEKIEKIILDYIGVLGWAKASCVFVKGVGKLNGKKILSVDRKNIEEIRAAIETSNSRIEIKRVSGTLKGLYKT